MKFIFRKSKHFSAVDVLKMIRSGRSYSPKRTQAHIILKHLKEIAPYGWDLKTVKVADVNRRDTDKWEFYPQKVEKYVKMKEQELPPIVVTSRGYDSKQYASDLLPGSKKSNYTIIDGQHRHEAAIQRGDETIPAYVPRKEP